MDWSQTVKPLQVDLQQLLRPTTSLSLLGSLFFMMIESLFTLANFFTISSTFFLATLISSSPFCLVKFTW